MHELQRSLGIEAIEQAHHLRVAIDIDLELIALQPVNNRSRPARHSRLDLPTRMSEGGRDEKLLETRTR